MDEAEEERAHRWAEGVAALSALVSARMCAVALDALSKTENPLVRATLFSGIVVNYSRGFEPAFHVETGISHRFKIKGFKSEHFNRNTHDEMLTLRNRQVAHAGHGLNDFSLSFLRINLKQTNLPDEGAQILLEKAIPVGTRARASLACGLDEPVATERLMAHLKALETEAATRLVIAMTQHEALSWEHMTRCETEGRPFGKSLLNRQMVLPAGMVILGEEDLTVSLASSPNTLPLAFAVLSVRVIETAEDVGVQITISELEPRPH
jgi:hypothetical protein